MFNPTNLPMSVCIPNIGDTDGITVQANAASSTLSVQSVDSIIGSITYFYAVSEKGISAEYRMPIVRSVPAAKSPPPMLPRLRPQTIGRYLRWAQIWETMPVRYKSWTVLPCLRATIFAASPGIHPLSYVKPPPSFGSLLVQSAFPLTTLRSTTRLVPPEGKAVLLS